jgi:hypothetical protein
MCRDPSEAIDDKFHTAAEAPQQHAVALDMGCYEIINPAAKNPNTAAAAAAARGELAAAAASISSSGSSSCMLWTGEAGGKLVQHYQQYLQGQLQLNHPASANGHTASLGSNRSFASYPAAAAAGRARYSYSFHDEEQPFDGLSPSNSSAAGGSRMQPHVMANRQQSITAALSGLRRNSLTMVGLGIPGSNSSKLHKGSVDSSSVSSRSRRVSAVRRPRGWWQQLIRGLFGIGVVEEEHADR